MATLKEAAQAYEPQQTKNIADLEKVSVDVVIEERIFNEGKDDEFVVNVALIDNVEYRVPNSVLLKLQEFLKKFPAMKEFSVMKRGEGMKTQYEVIPMGV